jgi:NADH dehydrogenase [ubiquinone] 1 alpha subcomplex assembly factor 7
VTPHLVETSPVLRAIQERILAGKGAVWHTGIETLPDGPAILLANEFFDCLPVRQFERRTSGWHERQIGLGPEGDLVYGLAPEATPGIEAEGPEGRLLSVPGVGLALMRQLARRVRESGGALLAIDYGHMRPGFGDTLQALSGHRFADPLAAPGQADLTHHVDFAALAKAAQAEGATIHGPVAQRDFLLTLGLNARAERLKMRATAAQAGAIDAAVERLTDASPTGMGNLFKVLAVTAPDLGPLPGLPEA